MAVFSAIFVLATAFFYRLGLQDVSLIYANIVNLASRILFSAHFVSKYYSEKGDARVFRWASIWPHWFFIGLVALFGSILRASAVLTMNDLKHDRPLDSSMLRASVTYLGGGAALVIMASALWWFQTGRRLMIPSSESV
jgi:oligosaccharide translocation protein RFT1